MQIQAEDATETSPKQKLRSSTSSNDGNYKTKCFICEKCESKNCHIYKLRCAQTLKIRENLKKVSQQGYDDLGVSFNTNSSSL